MKYPNAFKGVSRIYSAELLKILAEVLSIVVVIIVAVAAVGLGGSVENGALDNFNPDNANAAAIGGTTIITLLLSIAAGVISIIAFILNIVGVSNASKDEDKFKSALVLLLFGLIFSSVGSIIASWNQPLSTAFTTARDVCEAISIFMILDGIRNLADNIGDTSTSSLAQKTIKIIIGVYAIIILAEIIGLILGLIPAAATAAAVIVSVLGIIASVLDIIAYFIYLRTLAKAKKMLAA